VLGNDCARHIRRELDPRYRALGLRPPYLIGCTASHSVASRVACEAAGMNDFCPKPIVVEALVDCLERAHIYFNSES